MVKKAQEVQEATENTSEETSLPLGTEKDDASGKETEDSRFVSSAEKVAESLDTEESSGEDSEAESDEALLKEIDSEIEDLSSELTDDEMKSAEDIAETGEEESESLESEEKPDSEKSDGKSNVEKRINKLVGEKKTAEEAAIKSAAEVAMLKERLDKLESVKTEKLKEDKDERLSDAELKGVINTALEEGDAQTILDVIKYNSKITKEDALKELNDRETKKQEKIQAHNAYWQTIVKDFIPESYKSNMVKNDNEFDLSNPNSALYKRSEELYLNPQNFKKYREVGNMRSAVQDAFIELLSAKIDSGGSKKKKKEMDGEMNRKAKDNRKKSAGSGASSIGDSSAKDKAAAEDDLAEVLNERRQVRAKAFKGTSV